MGCVVGNVYALRLDLTAAQFEVLWRALDDLMTEYGFGPVSDAFFGQLRQRVRAEMRTRGLLPPAPGECVVRVWGEPWRGREDVGAGRLLLSSVLLDADAADAGVQIPPPLPLELLPAVCCCQLLCVRCCCWPAVCCCRQPRALPVAGVTGRRRRAPSC